MCGVLGKRSEPLMGGGSGGGGEDSGEELKSIGKRQT
jgi:hypothetical protein